MGPRYLAAMLLLAGCGADAEPVQDPDDVNTGEVVEDTAVSDPCPLGEQEGEDGQCIAMGLQGCAAIFIDPADGLCKPSMEACAKGEIPVFAEGCRTVGIPDCYEPFIDPADGLCKPSMEACAKGEIPHPTEGCQAVGISDCAAIFVDPETGHCDPDPDLCEAGFIPVPTQGCVSLEPADGCGTGTWGNVEALDGDVHVDPAYDGEDPDGSRDAPWPLIAYALGHVEAGGRIVLAGGDYEEAVTLKKPIGLVGRCSSMVTLRGTKALGPFAIAVRVLGASGVTISDLTISAPGFALDVAEGASLTLSRVALIDSVGFGIFVEDAQTELVADHLLVEGTRALADGQYGRGVAVAGGATVHLHRSAILDNQDVGISAESPGTETLLDDVLVARTQRSPSGTGGGGASCQAGAALTLSRVAVVDNHDIGLASAHGGTKLTLEQSVVLRTQPSLDGETGRGLDVVQGATADLSRTALVGNHEAGMLVRGAGSGAVVSDALIAGTEPRPVGDRGYGALADSGASLTLFRTALFENTYAGMVIAHEGTGVDVIDSTIEETRPLEAGTAGRGVEVSRGASMVVKRSALVRNHDIAILVADEGSQVVVEDAIIAETRMRGDGKNGKGLLSSYGSTSVIRRSALVDNHDSGVTTLAPTATVTVERSLVARTRPVADGTRGRGIEVGESASLWLSRSAIIDNPEFGVLAASSIGASVTDVLIEGIEPTGSTLYGDGLAIVSSTVVARGVFSRNNTRASVLFNNGQGALEASHGQDSVYGVVIQNGLGDALEIAVDCLFEGNETDEESDASLSVPNEAVELPTVVDLDD